MKKRFIYSESGRLLISALITYFAFSMKLDIPDFGSIAHSGKMILHNLTGSFVGFSVSHAVLLPGLYLLYAYINKKVERRDRLSSQVIIPAAFFSLFMILGHSFAVLDSWDMLVGLSNGQTLKAIFIAAGYFIFFSFTIAYLYYFCDQCSKLSGRESRENVQNKYFSLLQKHAFRTVFVTLTLAFVPYMALSFPAIFMGDSPNQMSQAFEHVWIEYGLKDFGNLNSSHPIAHTLLIRGFLMSGNRLFNSYNLGIFLYSLVQALVFFAAIAVSVSMLYRRKMMSEKQIVLTELYVFFNPMIHNYPFLLTKDVFYGIFFLVMLVHLGCLMRGKYDRKTIAGFVISCLGVILFRKEGWLILILSFFIIGIFSAQYRKPALLLIPIIFICNILFSRFVFTGSQNVPVENETQITGSSVNDPENEEKNSGERSIIGSVGPMITMVFQQTARCVRDHSDEITPEEKAAIERIFIYDRLADAYNPYIADGLFNIFSDNSTNEDFLNYIRVWFQMMVKHPGTYFQALWNNKYQFFYPGETFFDRYSYSWSDEMMSAVNGKTDLIGAHFSFPEKMKKIREISDMLNENANSAPFTSMMATPAIYVWALILLCFYGSKKNNKKIQVLLVIPFVLFLTLMAGPVNGSYGRYLFPFVLSLSFIIIMILSFVKEENSYAQPADQF